MVHELKDKKWEKGEKQKKEEQSNASFPPASKVSKEVTSFTERKNIHNFRPDFRNVCIDMIYILYRK